MKTPSNKEFREIVFANADRIYNHAFRMLGNREDAEEAVQDIFMKAHRGLNDFRGRSEIRTWLYRITVNTCLTRLRRKKVEFVRPEPDESGGWDTLDNQDPNPEELLIEADQGNLVIKAMEKISPEEKEVLMLFHVDELTYEEISKVLAVPVGTVCARIYRARRSLRNEVSFLQNEFKA